MGRVRTYIRINGRKCWTLFDSGAENTYVTPEVAQILGSRKLPRVWPVKLGGNVHRIKQKTDLIAAVEGRYIEVDAYVIDEIGTDRRSAPPKPFEILFGAFAMKKWGIGLDLKKEKLDMRGYTREFVEF